MKLNRRVKRLEDAAIVPGAGDRPKSALCVAIYTGRDEHGQPIPKDEVSRVAMQRTTGGVFYIPDNRRDPVR